MVYERINRRQQEHHRVAVQVYLLQWKSTRYGADSRVKEKVKDSNVKVKEKISNDFRKVRKATENKTGQKVQRKDSKEKDSKETRQKIKPGLKEANPRTRVKAKATSRQYVTSVVDLDILLETVGVKAINQDLSQQLFKNISVPVIHGIKKMTLRGKIHIGIKPSGIKRLNGMIKDLLSRRSFHLLLNPLVLFDGRINPEKFKRKFEFTKKFNVIQMKVKISRTRSTSVLFGSPWLEASNGTRL